MQATDDALTAEKNAEIAEIATVAARAAVCCLLIKENRHEAYSKSN